MKIGVDAGCLGVTDRRLKVGVYQVTLNLLKELAKIDRQNDYLLFSFEPIEKKTLSLFGSKMKNIIARPARGWRYLGLPLTILRNQVDFFIGPSQALPALIRCPSLVIFHDLGFEHYPQFYADYQRLRQNSQQAAGKATRIVAVSQSTKNDLVRLYQVPEEKIKVVYEGCGKEFKPGKIKGNYFLFVGSLKKSKNLVRLIEAFAQFLKISQKEFFLILAGGDFWPDDEIKFTVKRLSLKNKVTFFDFVESKDLPGLYSAATAFVSPALYEGFGITLLEALSSGCPLIAGNTGSQPEVIGKAGVLVDPKDVSAITKAMIKITSDTAFRQQLIRTGLQQAKKFSWQSFAQEILAAI